MRYVTYFALIILGVILLNRVFPPPMWEFYPTEFAWCFISLPLSKRIEGE